VQPRRALPPAPSPARLPHARGIGETDHESTSRRCRGVTIVSRSVQIHPPPSAPSLPAHQRAPETSSTRAPAATLASLTHSSRDQVKAATAATHRKSPEVDHNCSKPGPGLRKARPTSRAHDSTEPRQGHDKEFSRPTGADDAQATYNTHSPALRVHRGCSSRGCKPSVVAEGRGAPFDGADTSERSTSGALIRPAAAPCSKPVSRGSADDDASCCVDGPQSWAFDRPGNAITSELREFPM